MDNYEGKRVHTLGSSGVIGLSDPKCPLCMPKGMGIISDIRENCTGISHSRRQMANHQKDYTISHQ